MDTAVDKLVSRAAACHREVALEYFNAFAGLQDRLDVGPIIERYPELYANETWSYISELDENVVPDERVRRFLRLTFSGFLGQARLRDLTEQLANAESSATAEVDGEQVPFRALHSRIANEPDDAKRGELDGKHIEVLASLNPLREQMAQRRSDIVRELGYANTPAMVAALKNLDPPGFAATCRDFLDRSDVVYEDRLEQYANAAGLERGAVRHADISFILRANRFDDHFPPREMLPALARTLDGLGIDLESQKNVTLDLE
ncbi:MAG: hypothetical protein M3R04_08695, partial [bacterium]|nr:hypothetical protein [bacterium]